MEEWEDVYTDGHQTSIGQWMEAQGLLSSTLDRSCLGR